MYVKTLPSALIDGFGQVTDGTDEIELLFEEHDIHAVVRELDLDESRFWLFEIGAQNANGILVLRSTPFLPLGHTVDEAAEYAQLMITYRGREIDGSLSTGQMWVEYSEFGDPPMTKTAPLYVDDIDDEWVERPFDDEGMAN